MRKVTIAALSGIWISVGLVACGGGGGAGGSDGTAPTQPSQAAETTTYGDANLPGRLFVTDPSGPAALFDLRTGARSTVPNSAQGDYHGATGATYMLRVTGGRPAPNTLERIRTSDWSVHGKPTTIPGVITLPRVSPDGRYILTFWKEDEGDPYSWRLTIFDAESGQPVKKGSQLNGEIMTNTPAAWLPDGRYMYLAGRDLYVSSLTEAGSTKVATLPLPDNSVFQDNAVKSNFSAMSASPDGTHLAFDWGVRRPASGGDAHIFVVRTDGTGLRQLTAPPDPNLGVDYRFLNPTWSPDGRWVAGGLYMQGTTIAPIFPPDQSFPGVPGGVIGATGCSTNPVWALPADANQVPISWPTYDVAHSIKVRNETGDGGRWVSTCGTVHWLP